MKSYSELVKNFVAIAKTKKKLNYSHTEIGKLIKIETNFLDSYHPKASLRERLYYIELDLFEIVKCGVCNKVTNWNNGPTKLCVSCVKRSAAYNKKIRATKLKLYGNETYNNVDKAKATKLKLYGNETYNNADKIYSTYIKNHGSIGFANSDIRSRAITKYCKNPNHNFSSFSQIPDVKQKLSNTIRNNFLSRFNNWKSLFKNPKDLNNDELLELFKSINNDEWLRNKLVDHSPSVLANKCGIDRQAFLVRLYNFGLYEYTGKSYLEEEMLELVKTLISNIQSNTRQIIPPLELDIYIPNNNLAIEMNGLFWHSSYSTNSENKDYHLHKTKECEKLGIQLFHIFENEWQNPTKQLIWKSIIKNRLGKSTRIFARKTILKPVSSTEKSEFLISNHLQGDCVSSVNLGLYMGDELVSLMTFGRSRYDKKIEWELLRFCNRVGCSVIGGASKLLKSFRKENPGSIISYADKRRSSGNLYKKLGFEFSHESSPNYFYWKPGSMMLESRIGYQKHKLKDKLEVFDPKLTESENMYSNGYRKIYDCGNQVWILK